MKIKTSELTGAALDWAVMKCEHPNNSSVGFFHLLRNKHPLHASFHYSANWAQGGPIIEREGINLNFMQFDNPQYWTAHIRFSGKLRFGSFGPTPLIAAMRCFVAAKLGDEVDVPEKLA